MTISQVVARSFRDDRIDELERENTELSAKILEQQAIIQTRVSPFLWLVIGTDLGSRSRGGLRDPAGPLSFTRDC
jgi:hypothetical protein